MLRERSDAPLPLGASAAIADTVATTHTQVNAARFATAWAAGRAMTLAQVIAYALEDEAAESGLRTAASVQATSTLCNNSNP